MFRKHILLLIVMFANSVLFAQTSGFVNHIYDYIENPSLFEVNQEKGRAYFISDKHISLNGKWKFFYNDVPEGIPVDFYKENYNDKKWADITVPSNWEMEGFGDKFFRNISASFPANPPHVPREYNPTGLYRKSFSIPSDWNGEEIFIRFEKVGSSSFVWINGQEVGYNSGAHEPAEYNITQYLKKGENELAVLVTKFSAGYYLEMQDYWRLAGIFGDVTLFTTPELRLFDWQVITDLDNTYQNADLKIITTIKNYNQQNTGNYFVKAMLYDNKNNLVNEFQSVDTPIESKGIHTISLQQAITNPSKWTAETPSLYLLCLELYDNNNNIIDRAEAKIGFKETEIRGSVFYLNGVPVKINAINSHMQHPEKGHVVDEATIRKDFEILKQFNFNAVRTSHYPPASHYVELAGEYGIYIIDEVGDEAHASEWLSDSPEYAEMYKDRARKLVLRDRNYPAVLFWSAGNESGNGVNITKVIEEGKKLDPTRYWMYGGNDFSHPAEDIIGPRYPNPFELEVQLGINSDQWNNNDKRPSFMDEYLSVAGNGGGGMDDYWKAIYAHPRLMGGAIWDFVSPGITEKVRKLEDSSPYHTPTHLMGKAQLVKDGKNSVLDLNGHDQWVEIYRQNNLEITGKNLIIRFDVYPRDLIDNWGSFITKGNNQFGIEQHEKNELEFYIYTDKKYSLKVSLSDNWKHNWHKVMATYNGNQMALYIDGVQKGNIPASGDIKNAPFPVNIGRNAEIHGQETRVYICDARFDNVGIFTDDLPFDSLKPERAVLWLDFEKETSEGTFYSYGIGARTYGSIWPDRTVQPEMWQMKKTVQPLSFRLLDENSGSVEVWNRNHFTNASYYRTQWFLMEDDRIIQQGELDLHTQPISKEIIQIPYTKPSLTAGKEYRILVSSSLKKAEIWAEAGHEVAWDQLGLSWYEPAEKQKSENSIPVINDNAGKLTISGKNFSYTFDKIKGQLISIRYDGKELIHSPLTLNLWRAPLANEVDNWNSGNSRSNNWKPIYGNHIVTEMYSTGIDNPVHQPVEFEYEQTSGGVTIRIVDLYLTSLGEKEQKDFHIEGIRIDGIRNEYSMTINGDGELKIHHVLSPYGNMPVWFPRVGLTTVFNKTFKNVEWYGRGPQENYPDRKTGYKTGIYKTTVDEMYEPYLLPQDYGLRTDNRWVRLSDENGTGIDIRVNELFNFNAYPYSTDNLTKAMYTYQLQPFDGVTFNLDYKTTGVGCTSRSVFPSYRTMPTRYERIVSFSPVNLD